MKRRVNLSPRCSQVCHKARQLLRSSCQIFVAYSPPVTNGKRFTRRSQVVKQEVTFPRLFIIRRGECVARNWSSSVKFKRTRPICKVTNITSVLSLILFASVVLLLFIFILSLLQLDINYERVIWTAGKEDMVDHRSRLITQLSA